MRALRKQGWRYKNIASEFGCSIAHVAAIISGRVGVNDDKMAPEPKPHVPNAMPGITLKQLTARR